MALTILGNTCTELLQKLVIMISYDNIMLCVGRSKCLASIPISAGGFVTESHVHALLFPKKQVASSTNTL